MKAFEEFKKQWENYSHNTYHLTSYEYARLFWKKALEWTLKQRVKNEQLEEAQKRCNDYSPGPISEHAIKEEFGDDRN